MGLLEEHFRLPAGFPVQDRPGPRLRVVYWSARLTPGAAHVAAVSASRRSPRSSGSATATERALSPDGRYRPPTESVNASGR